MVATAAYFLFAAVLLTLNFNVILVKVQRQYWQFMPFIVVVVLMSFVNFFRDYAVLYHLLVTFFSLGLAAVLASNPSLFYRMSKIGLILFQSIVIVLALRIGFANFPFEPPLEKIIPNSSANGITSYMIILQVNLSLQEYINKKRINILLPLVTLIVAFMGYGRSSIVAALLILIIAITVNTIFSEGLRRKIYLYGTSVISALLFIIFIDDVLFFLEARTKLGAGFQDAQRGLIIEDYLNKINGWTFLVGADYENTRIEYRYNGNPHITFIRAHHIFGLPYLLCIIFLLISPLFKTKNRIDGVFIAGFLGVIFLRAATEPIIFPTQLDFFVFALMFLLINENKDVETEHLSIEEQ